VRGLGTLINLATVLAGGLTGVFIGDRLPERARRTVMQGLGLVTIAVAVVGFEPLFDPDEGLKRFVILIVSIIAGGLIGELLMLEERLEGAGEWLRTRFARMTRVDSDQDHGRFVEGFVIATTVFCVGPLTILGAVEDGLGLSIRLLAIKSTLDGFAAIGFASIYGWGVLASLISIALIQGLITAGSALISPLMTSEVIAQLGATGSLLILGISFRLLDIAKVRIMSLLPALLIASVTAGVVEAVA
jgi:uncharacterized membrane protein YqgA involved in biofilm formation